MIDNVLKIIRKLKKFWSLLNYVQYVLYLPPAFACPRVSFIRSYFYVLFYLGPLCAIVLLHVLVSLIHCSFTFPCVITCSYTLRTLNLVCFFMLIMLFCLSCFWTHCVLCSLDVSNTSYALLCNLPSCCTLFNPI